MSLRRGHCLVPPAKSGFPTNRSWWTSRESVAAPLPEPLPWPSDPAPFPAPVLTAFPPLSYEIHAEGASHIGRVRKRNEDSFAVHAELGLVVVADGMGGHPGGDVASRTATHEAGIFLQERLPLAAGARPDKDLALAELGQTMEAVATAAHAAVRAHGKTDPVLARMGTTFTAMVVDLQTGIFGIGHVGDSRAYRLRDGDLLQLTRDDTWVQERVENEDFTPEQARRHPFAHLVTQALGLDDAPEPHVVTGEVAEGDTYLLCTDGLVGMLDDEAVGEHLTEGAGDPPGTIAQRLVDAANESGGRDNITVVVLRIA